MAKKPVTLDGLVQPDSRSFDTGIPQRGSAISSPGDHAALKRREGQKRLTLALDGDTYRRLRMYAAQTDRTHQDILETALMEFLNCANA